VATWNGGMAVVGGGGTVAIMSAAGWSRQDAPTSFDLNAVWHQGDDLFVAGRGGTILRIDR